MEDNLIITDIHHDTGQDGKLEEISGIVVQSSKYWSLLWVNEMHPCHEAAIPEVQVMHHMFPTSPEAADGAVVQDCNAKYQNSLSRKQMKCL